MAKRHKSFDPLAPLREQLRAERAYRAEREQERVLHREGLPFLIAARGWCEAAGTSGAYFCDAMRESVAAAERYFAPREGNSRSFIADVLRELAEPDWTRWLRVAVPAAITAADARHGLDEALQGWQGRSPSPVRPDWDNGAPRDGGEARPPRLAWETSHSIILAPSETGEGWTLTVWGPCGGSYRHEAAEAAIAAAEERLGLRPPAEAAEAAANG